MAAREISNHELKLEHIPAVDQRAPGSNPRESGAIPAGLATPLLGKCPGLMACSFVASWGSDQLLC